MNSLVWGVTSGGILPQLVSPTGIRLTRFSSSSFPLPSQPRTSVESRGSSEVFCRSGHSERKDDRVFAMLVDATQTVQAAWQGTALRTLYLRWKHTVMERHCERPGATRVLPS